MAVLRFLLWLLPAEFRREYGTELLHTAELRWRELRPGLGPTGRMVFWLRQASDLVKAGISLRLGSGILGAADRKRRTPRAAGMGNELRQTLRSLVRRPGFSAIVVLTLGLGVGAATTMWSVVRAVLLDPLPYPDAGRIAVLERVDARDGSPAGGVAAANLRDVAASASSLEAAAIAARHGLRLMEDGRAVSLRAWVVSEGFFEALGMRVAHGRSFDPEEYQPGNERVVLLGHEAWRSRFGGELTVLGRDLVLDGSPHRVVGILPAGFRYPSTADLWAPRPFRPEDESRRGFAGFASVVRLAPGVEIHGARAELEGIAAGLSAAHPEANAHLAFRILSLRQHLLGHVRAPLLLLLGAVGLVLLIAVANVAGLQLARGAARGREFALRGALGAQSPALLRLVTVESLLLGAAGGLVGIVLARGSAELVRRSAPAQVPRLAELRIDLEVLALAVLLALASALCAGLIPAARAGKLDPSPAMTGRARGAGGSRHEGRLRDRLVVAEIALALMLTIGAGLLLRSYERLLANELGFDPAGRLAVQVWAYDDQHRIQEGFFERGLEELRALPGVEAVGLTSDLPLADDRSISARTRHLPFRLSGQPGAWSGSETVAGVASIDGVYPEAMGIALESGRAFSASDHRDALPVAMVNQAFARRYLPGRQVIGQRVVLDQGPGREIVGVLGDVRRRGFASDPRPEIYLPISQVPSAGLTFVILGRTRPASLLPAVREALRAADPRQAVWAARPMTDLLSDGLRERRFHTGLLLAFAVLALGLSAVGVYGLMAFSVEQRIGELGIRRALGGQARDILGLVLYRGWILAASGVGIGLLGSAALAQMLRGMLFGVSPFDLPTFLALAVFVVLVMLLASLIPARRAVRVDPVSVLRTD